MRVGYNVFHIAFVFSSQLCLLLELQRLYLFVLYLSDTYPPNVFACSALQCDAVFNRGFVARRLLFVSYGSIPVALWRFPELTLHKQIGMELWRGHIHLVWMTAQRAQVH